MIDPPAPLDPPPDPYNDDLSVYRGARNKQYIVDGEVTHMAFLRRSPDNPENKRADPNGLSIATTQQDSVARLTRHYGVIAIKVGDIRSLDDEQGQALDVQPDMAAVNKGNIKNVPYFDEPHNDDGNKRGLRVAEKLARIARVDPYAPSR